jgi:ornithine decarboxylase
MSATAFTEPIKNARLLFNYVEETYDHKLMLLDLGGGYPGSPESKSLFDAIAQDINSSLDKYFPTDEVKIIAEPGRYIPCSAFTLVVNVIARRVIEGELKKSFMYYVNDGIFASFNCLIYDHVQEFPPILLRVRFSCLSNLKMFAFVSLKRNNLLMMLNTRPQYGDQLVMEWI